MDPTHHTLFKLGSSMCAAEASHGSLRLVVASSSSFHTNIDFRRSLMESYMFSFHGCFGVDPTRTHSIALCDFLSRDSSEDWAGAA